MRLLALSAVVFLLSGCVADHRERQEVSFAATPLALPALTRGELDGALAALRADVQSSQNATQNSISGIGLNVGKVAEKLEADLLRIQTDIHANLNTVVTAQTELRASLRADISTAVTAQASLRADLQANLNAAASLQAQAIANLETKLNALVQTTANLQAGIANRSETTTNTAGRDINTEFTREMQGALASDNRALIWVVAILTVFFCIVIVILSDGSRRRAESRYREALNGRKA